MLPFHHVFYTSLALVGTLLSIAVVAYVSAGSNGRDATWCSS